MPSALHESILLLFRNCPELAPLLLREALHIELPPYASVRIESAELSDVVPTEYRADLVVLLLDGKPVLGIVVEVQLRPDERKRFTWPVYTVNLRANLECDTCVLVIAPDAATARWAAVPIKLGPGHTFTPIVLGANTVPIVTSADEAIAHPELAVLSALAHGKGPRGEEVGLAAIIAASALDQERAVLYSDLTLAWLNEAAKVALEKLMAQGNYVFQSDFSLRNQAIGRAEGELKGKAEGELKGKAEGKANAILLVLKARAISVTDAERARVMACTSDDTLDRWVQTALTATRSEELV
jgi:hypothetical protein